MSVLIFDKDDVAITVSAHQATELIKAGIVIVHDDPGEGQPYMVTLFVDDLEGSPYTLDTVEGFIKCLNTLK